MTRSQASLRAASAAPSRQGWTPASWLRRRWGGVGRRPSAAFSLQVLRWGRLDKGRPVFASNWRRATEPWRPDRRRAVRVFSDLPVAVGSPGAGALAGPCGPSRIWRVGRA
eukprot:scaffold647_cov411-Prasinococcus_capsulatus_cf.AAC.14